MDRIKQYTVHRLSDCKCEHDVVHYATSKRDALSLWISVNTLDLADGWKGWISVKRIGSDKRATTYSLVTNGGAVEVKKL